MDNNTKLQNICRLLRYDILTSTTKAGAGHPTSSLSAVELLTVLFFGGFLKENDKFILSKGHAAPLLYSLYHAAGLITYDELLTLRTFNSTLEGHPTPRFKYVDVATGSLGQGLSVGVGMTLGMKLNVKRLTLNLPRVWVLFGDSEMAEGQIWEAMEIASYYKLNNLIGILDVNRLGQRGETMLGWDLETYQKRISSFGWETIIVEDGNNIQQVYKAFRQAVDDRGLTIDLEDRSSKLENNQSSSFNLHNPASILDHPSSRKPTMIIAKTVKGKGISFLEDKNGWHGKPVPEEKLQEALKELGEVDLNVRGNIQNVNFQIQNTNIQTNPNFQKSNYKINDIVATREAYGDALEALGQSNQQLVVLDAEVSNSTFSEKFAKKFPERFFEMFIAEQNMISTALGLSKEGFVPFVSTFAAFLTRTFDQIRMSQYSNPNLKLVGSHAGVSIGSDGPSQMGLEDLAMMRTIKDSVIFYPSDAVSAFKLTEIMAKTNGLFYLRTTRGKTAVIYNNDEKFETGGSKIIRQSPNDKAVIIGAGITVHEALKAYQELKNEQIYVTVVDLYSVKPVDEKTILQLAEKTKNFIVVEDHYPAGGIGDAVLKTISNFEFRISNFIHLCVSKTPRSGSPEELLGYEEINSAAIVKKVKEII